MLGKSRRGRSTALHHTCQRKYLSNSQLSRPSVTQIEVTRSQVHTPVGGGPSFTGGTVGSAPCAYNTRRSSEDSSSFYSYSLSSSLNITCSQGSILYLLALTLAPHRDFPLAQPSLVLLAGTIRMAVDYIIYPKVIQMHRKNYL